MPNPSNSGIKNDSSRGSLASLRLNSWSALTRALLRSSPFFSTSSTWDNSRFHGITDLDLDILHAVVREGPPGDAGVLVAQLQADDLAVLPDGVRPDHSREANVDTQLKHFSPKMTPTILARKTSICAWNVLMRNSGTFVLSHPHSWYLRSQSGSGVDLVME
ncbi:hypothetical protein VSDG_05423 [Cytospora chrysosperma]|uniref:Uncharacterized protein n=1 Tax=Cytospora chrysosperma TaxID=252740 RepID=A0A423VZD8_CYTCH|nr:hypothetical protein VSDG_05423 [Valsa sordida]